MSSRWQTALHAFVCLVVAAIAAFGVVEYIRSVTRPGSDVQKRDTRTTTAPRVVPTVTAIERRPFTPKGVEGQIEELFATAFVDDVPFPLALGALQRPPMLADELSLYRVKVAPIRSTLRFEVRSPSAAADGTLDFKFRMWLEEAVLRSWRAGVARVDDGVLYLSADTACLTLDELHIRCE